MTKYYTKLAWLGMILMTIDLLIIGEAGIKLTAEIIENEEVFKLVDLGMGSVISIIRYIKIVGIVPMLCLVLSKKTFGKLWYAPMAAAGAVGILSVLCLILMKNNLITASGLGEAMDFFSIKCKVTGVVWGFAITSVVETICGIVPFFEKK